MNDDELTDSTNRRLANFTVGFLAVTKDKGADAFRECQRTERLIETYLTQLGTELLPDGPMFRNQARTAYSKDALCRSFRKVLKAQFAGEAIHAS